MSASKPAYISKVHLKGYKSIKDLEIDLQPGLNIIIGPNGSGKTNFLEFLDMSMNRASFDKEIYSEILSITKNGNSALSIKSYSKLAFNDENFEIAKLNFEQKEFYNGELVFHQKIPISKNKTEILPATFRDGFITKTSAFLFTPIKIDYNLPDFDIYKYGLVEPAKIEIHSVKETLMPEFTYNPSWLFTMILQDNIDNIKSTNNLLAQIDIEILRRNLNLYTPIKNIAFDEDRYYQYEEKGSIENESVFTVNRIFFKFQIDNKWLNWDNLSDGTKRIFWISAVLTYGKYLILIEEPELGLHPNQLQKLMQFLKEQSKEKQIIITTHSPEVLNILGEDELDRIIVTRYDSEKGTKMYQLSEKEQTHVRNYMKHQASISDYWIQSGFEKENEEEVTS